MHSREGRMSTEQLYMDDHPSLDGKRRSQVIVSKEAISKLHINISMHSICTLESMMAVMITSAYMSVEGSRDAVMNRKYSTESSCGYGKRDRERGRVTKERDKEEDTKVERGTPWDTPDMHSKEEEIESESST
jgi:hypothetical protein